MKRTEKEMLEAAGAPLHSLPKKVRDRERKKSTCDVCETEVRTELETGAIVCNCPGGPVDLGLDE